MSRSRGSRPLTGGFRRHARAIAAVGAGVVGLVAAAGFGTPALRPVALALIGVGILAIVVVEVAAATTQVGRTISSDTVVAGDAITATVVLSGFTPRKGLLHLLNWSTDAGGPGGTRPLGRTTERGGGQVREQVTLSGVPRGEHTLRGPSVRLSDPFGLVAVRRVSASAATLIATPRTVPIDKPFWEGRTGSAGDPGGRFRGRTELAGVRDYEHGDPMSLIHWTQTARRGRLQTKELHGESGRGRRFMIVLDRRSADADSFELAVSAAASLVRTCADHDRAVGMSFVGHAVEYWPPGTDLGVLERALAVIAQEQSHSIAHHVRSVIHRGDGVQTIALVTATSDPALASAVASAAGAGMRVAAVLVGQAAADAPALRRAGAWTTTVAAFDELRSSLDVAAVAA